MSISGEISFIDLLARDEPHHNGRGRTLLPLREATRLAQHSFEAKSKAAMLIPRDYLSAELLCIVLLTRVLAAITVCEGGRGT